MTEIAARYRKVAGEFTKRVRAVPPDAWDNPSPCEGWVARDVVGHLVEWIPGFFSAYAGLELPTGRSSDGYPFAAWAALDAAVQAALDAPDTAARQFEMRGERYTIEQAVDTFCTGDVLTHTWDLARAAGLDDTLDADEVHRMLIRVEPLDDLLRRSGHYGPRVDVADDADEQTRLLAFLGRQP
jgi:uncharacterized protein (TIGR03086 family)